MWSLAKSLFGPTVAEYSAALLWGTPTILLVGSTARVDVSLTLFLVLAHNALLTAWRQRSLRHLDLAALLLGLSLGVKYQAGAYALTLAPLVVLAARSLRPSSRLALGLLVRFTMLATCALAPWLLKNQLLFGNPFYPFFAGHPVQPWLAPLLDDTRTVALDPRIFRLQSMARTSFNLSDAFLNPMALGMGGEMSFYFLNPVLLLAPLCLLAALDWAVASLAAPSLLYVLAVLIISPKANLRYLIPGIVPITIVCVRMLVAATSRLPTIPSRAVRSLVCIVSLTPTVGSMFVWITGSHAVPALFGAISSREYLARHVSPVVRSHARIAAEVNKLVGPRDTILMVFEARGLYLNAPALEDTELTNWPSLANALGDSRCLHHSGITYVLARQGAARYHELRGVPDTVLGLRSFERFAARCLTPVFRDTSATLYLARPPR
jgi:hypothetical protein